MSSALYQAPKNSLSTLAALVGNLFCIYSASPRRQKDHLCSGPPHKNYLFRGLIKYLAHNHPHITTIL